MNYDNNTATTVHINYLSGTITIESEYLEDDRKVSYIITIESNKLVNIESNYIPYLTGVGKGLLGTYTKSSAYSAVTQDDSISKAIGKLEANVEKIITSGNGTKFLSDDGQYKQIGIPIEAVGSSGAITQELSPNTYYKFSRCTSLTITLGAEVSGILNEYMFEFISGVTPTVLNLPETVKWNNGNVPTIEPNKKYIVSIISNIAVIGGA